MTPDLRSRLARLGYRLTPTSELGQAHEVSKPSPRGPALWSAHTSPPERGRSTIHPIDDVVPGRRVATPHGECFVAEHHHPPGHLHGSHRLEEALELDAHLFEWLGRDSALADFDPARSVFLDVETTGLAGGTGTYAFLVGLAHFEGPRFVVRQFFMEDYDAEASLLHAVAEALEPFQGVVTFNGKAFDLPLLETRFLMARRPFALQGVPHLDLLFPSRRLWRERLESCALSNLEREILGVEREGDVPGFLIPGIYFDYLQSGDAQPLGPIFEHNRQDLLSLATLTTRLARQYADPFHPSVEDGRDLFALGRAFEMLELADRAVLCYERALALLPPGQMHDRAMVGLGSLYKRLRLRQDAVGLWRKLAASGRTFTTMAYVELAKHYEHVERDHREAERFTLQALAALELRAARGEPWRVEQERRDLEHRLARLRRKMDR